MASVQTPPPPTSNLVSSHDSAQPLEWLDPQQGVIEEARKRQRRRRARLAVAGTIVAVGLMALAFVLESSHASSARQGASDARRSASSSGPDFNVRFAPALEVGRTGWQLFYEEHGAQMGGEGIGAALSSDPIVASDGSGASGSHRMIANFVTTSNVAFIQLNGNTRVPTVALPGLPYGFRAAHVVTTVSSAEESLPSGVGRQTQSTVSPVPLNAEGQPIPFRPNNLDPAQGTVRSWEYPGTTPTGSCGLSASNLGGLTAQGGKALRDMRPYPAKLAGGQIAGHAFLPCLSVLYHLHSVPLQAEILLDAAHPYSRAAALPDFKPVTSAPGFVDQGSLTAKREGIAWVIVGQGSGVSQRVELLRHLHALIMRGSLVQASTGVRQAGQADASPPPAPPFTLQVTPALQAGALGWQYLEREGSIGASGSCCSALTHPATIIGVSKDLRRSPGPWSIASVLTAPEVAAVSFEGRKPVLTHPDGLPYGMRFAVLPVKRTGATPVAFNASGQLIKAKGFETLPKRHQFEGPYAPHAWTAPAQPPSPAACEISASGSSGLASIGGSVVLHVTGYPLFESRAFQSCADTYYTLGGSRLQAAILLDAEHPGSRPAALPDMRPASGASGLFEAPGRGLMQLGGGSHQLTAKRLQGAWLVVTGGSGTAQQREVLRHLQASIHV